MRYLYYFKWSGKKIKHLMLGVTPQNQNGPKQEKDISKALVDFSFLTIQSKKKKIISSTNTKNYYHNSIKYTPQSKSEIYAIITRTIGHKRIEVWINNYISSACSISGNKVTSITIYKRMSQAYSKMYII